MWDNPRDMLPGTRAMAVDVYHEDLDATDLGDDDTVTTFD